MKRTHLLALLLCLSGVNLALMVPGGFVETRNFPGYSVVVLALFNVLLTVLGLGSLLLAYRAARSEPVARWAVLAGLTFMAVYLLDLGKIFPVAAEPMSVTLFTLEWIGTVLGLGVVGAGASLLGERSGAGASSVLPRWGLAVLGVLALAIVVFATLSAA